MARARPHQLWTARVSLRRPGGTWLPSRSQNVRDTNPLRVVKRVAARIPREDRLTAISIFVRPNREAIAGFVLLLALLLPGCGQTVNEQNLRSGLQSHTHLVKPESFVGQTIAGPEPAAGEVAWTACEDDVVTGARRMTGGVGAILPALVGYGVPAYKAFEDCMRDKGYRLVPR
jgi:hypothetical protein